MRKLMRWDLIAWVVLAVAANIAAVIEDGPPWRAIQGGGPGMQTVVAWLLAAYAVFYGYWIVTDRLATPRPITRVQRRRWMMLAALAVPLTLGLLLLASAMGPRGGPVGSWFLFGGLLLFIFSVAQLFRPRAE
jgi:hypothetical protein